jgi:hypothetical protein
MEFRSIFIVVILGLASCSQGAQTTETGSEIVNTTGVDKPSNTVAVNTATDNETAASANDTATTNSADNSQDMAAGTPSAAGSLPDYHTDQGVAYRAYRAKLVSEGWAPVVLGECYTPTCFGQFPELTCPDKDACTGSFRREGRTVRISARFDEDSSSPDEGLQVENTSLADR